MSNREPFENLVPRLALVRLIRVAKSDPIFRLGRVAISMPATGSNETVEMNVLIRSEQNDSFCLISNPAIIGIEIYTY